MKKIVLFVVLGLIIAVVGVGLYVMRPSAEASTPIQALPVQLQQKSTVPPTQAPAAQSSASLPAVTSAPVQATAPAASDPPSADGPEVYQIVQDESQVSFTLNEVLRGSPFTPVGKTNQVAGEVAIDFASGTVQLGVIQVNARTLKTDSSMRDRMIKNEILDTGTYEMITFSPKSITGLPETAQPGDEIPVQITGDLTIRDITREVTFTGKVKLVTTDRLEGSASATVLRSDYKLVIPNVRSVAGVSDEVQLAIQFVALKK